jgi:hypothetical protein
MRNLLLATLVLAGGTCFAQPPEQGWKFYKLDFAVKEVEGTKVLNSRTFSTIVHVDTQGVRAAGGSIRTGSKVPAGSNYIDVGVNIDTQMVKEVQGDVALSVSAEISGTPEGGNPDRPVIRQNKWSSYVVVPVKKPTVIFSSDDATTKHTVQLELTATPINLGATMK